MTSRHFLYCIVLITVYGLPVRGGEVPSAGQLMAHTRESALADPTDASLIFTENRGQWPDSILFRAAANGATLWFTRDGIYYQYSRCRKAAGLDRARMFEDRSSLPEPADDLFAEPKAFDIVLIKAELAGADLNAVVVGFERLPHTSNFFLRSDPSRWRSDVANYGALRIEAVYPGVDIVYRGRAGKLQCELIAASDDLLAQVQVIYRGADGIARREDGTADLQTAVGALTATGVLVSDHDSPVRREAAGQSNALANLPLSYSTYLGGNLTDSSRGIAVDGAGSAYVTGWTLSANFPTVNAYDESWNSSVDAFVTKLSADGASLIYSTYFGGTDADYGLDIAVDAAGCAHLTGYSSSCDFPITDAAFDISCNYGWDAFVAKLSPSGDSLIYGTYLGGTTDDWGWGIALDRSGNSYVIGYTNSVNFPTATPFDDSYNGAFDAFVTKLSPSGEALAYSTYLGGSANDWGVDLVVDTAGHAFVAGFTFSAEFPTVNPFDSIYDGSWDAFVAKFSPAGDSLEYSTLLGGTREDGCRGIAVDSVGCAYITGFTNSPGYPTLNPLDATMSGSFDAFVTKLNPSGNGLIYSTFLGGGVEEAGRRIALDDSGCVYVTGYTTSADFPTAPPCDGTINGGKDAFVTKLGPTGDTLKFSTYLGGSGDDFGNDIVLDGMGGIYVVGETKSTDFPVTIESQSVLAGTNLFVAKLDPGIDADGDGIADGIDNCPANHNPDQVDADHDGTGDVCDACTDTDGDGFGDDAYPANTCLRDNCPGVANPSQTDTNGDGIGDTCCCVSVRGNVNYTSIVDLADLSALVSYLTGGGYHLPCPNEANVNGGGIVYLDDLSALVSYLTGGGYVLPQC